MKQNYDHGAITAADFQRLQENPQPYSRVAIARKIAKHIETAEETSQEYELACEIAMYLQKDSSEVVRIALAETIGASSRTPKPLVVLLAKDEHDAVAVPVLRESPLLDDGTLELIINEARQDVRLIAIAQRRFLSVTITSQLVEKAVERVAITILQNDTAQISNECYARIRELHARNDEIMTRMVKRMPMPLSALDEYSNIALDTDQENVKVATIQSFASVSIEDLKSDIKLIYGVHPDAPIEKLMNIADNIIAAGQLNTNLMLIALNSGSLSLFTAFLTSHTHLPYSEVSRMCAGEAEQFKILFNRSNISSSLFPLLYWTLSGVHRTLKKGVEPCTVDFVNLMLRQAHDAETRGINFARTIGIPIATAVEKVYRKGAV